MGAGDKKGPNPAASGKPAAKSAADDKAQRRAEALRANLKRRKVQQRDRADTGKTSTDKE